MPSKDVIHNVYLSLGSNLGDKEKNLLQAIENINRQVGKVISLSSFYETAPVGFVSANSFLNAACVVETHLTALEVLHMTQEIEKTMGRVTKSVNHSYSDRIIDIDLLLYDTEIINDLALILPHPRLHERSFVLDPLAEIAGEIKHPTLGKTIFELKQELDNRKE